MRVKHDKQKGVLGLVFLTVFLDLVGFSIIFPSFPAMLQYYADVEGEAGLFGDLMRALEGWTAGAADPEFAIVALFGGVLGSVYSVLQFLGAPFWGSLSDRIGRRGTLLFTLTGTMLSYVVWFFSGSFLLFILARLFGGLMAGNIAIASAAVADTSEGKDRAKGMGIVGMAIGLGFVIGPAIGGFFSRYDMTPDGALPGESWLHPFSAAAIASAVLAVANLLWAVARFPETLPPEKRGGGDHHSLNPFSRLSQIDFPGVKRVNLLYLLYLTAFSAIEFTLTFLAAERFLYEPVDNAWMFVFVGLTIAFVQGGIVRRLAPKMGEKKLATVGIALSIPGFLAIGFSGSETVLFLGLGFMAVGSALAMPCLSALASRYTPPDVQGLALGVFRSMGSLSRAIGPVIGGLLYWRFGMTSPYLLGAATLLAPVLMAVALPPVPTVESEEPAAA